MRTTVTLDDDVASAVIELKRKCGLGVSEAVNQLVRRGLIVRPPERPFRQRTARLALKVDVTNVAEAIELLDGPGSS